MDSPPMVWKCKPTPCDLRHIPIGLPPEFLEYPSWAVPTVHSHDVLWSVVLAYLNPATCFRTNTVEDRIKLLLNIRRKPKKKFQNCVEKYNPFLSKTRCVCDDLMVEVVESFSLDVIDHCKNTLKVKTFGVFEILTASSALLLSNIVYVTREENGITSSTLFPAPQAHEVMVIFNDFIVENGIVIDRFYFSMTKPLGLKKQKKALKEILTTTKILEIDHRTKQLINDICLLPGITDNFIVSVIKSDLRECILPLYKSPYVLSKLCDAQFEIDPTSEDSDGLSALFYALSLDKTDLLYFLYDQAVNWYFSTKTAVRSPDPIGVMNLQSIQIYLSGLEEKLQSSTVENADTCRLRLDELGCFNRFQIEACCHISNSHLRIEGQLNEREEAGERKDMIISILKAYEEYFNWSSGENGYKGEIQLFKEFLKHAEYFNHLDFCAAIMFFDNLYSLMERLLLSDKKFSDIESQFFFFIYCRKYFDADKKTPSLYIVNRMIVFQERMLLKQKLASFKKELENVKITDENVILFSEKSNEPETPLKAKKKITKKQNKNDVETLTELPQIYGELLLCRLKQSLNAAIHVSPNDIKARFVIQRALYILGESVKDSDFKSIKKVLNFSLPPNFLSHLKQIRNTLTHYHLHQLPYREKAEENTDVLKDIQQELKTLMNFLLPVFRSHKNEMEIFNLKIALKAVGGARRKEPGVQYRELLLSILPSDSDRCGTESRDFDKGWKKYFDDVFSLLRTKLIAVSKECKVMQKPNVMWYKGVTSNIVSAVEKKLTAMADGDRNHLDIDDSFWCLEFLLKYIVKDKSLKHLSRKLLKLAKSRLSCYRKFTRNMNGFESNQTLLQTQCSADVVTDPVQDPVDNVKKFIQEMKNVLQDYRNITDEIFSLHENPSNNTVPQFKSIEKFRSTLKTGKEYLTLEESRRILQSIPTQYKEQSSAIKKIKEFFSKGKNINKEDAHEAVFKLSLTQTKQEELILDIQNEKYSKIMDSLPDYYEDLKRAINANEIGQGQLDLVCKHLELSASSRETLFKIVINQDRIPGNQFVFYRSRIRHLKSVLIEADRDVMHLWETARSDRKKTYLQEKLVNLFLSDPEIQATVEMLLFDCMCVLNTKWLRKLWVKTENLMRGIYMKNVLAHGNPLLETLGRFLDPSDLPSELIKKVLMLARDEGVLDRIWEVSQRTDGKLGSVMRLLESDEVDGLEDIRKEIKVSEQWKAYVNLFPR